MPQDVHHDYSDEDDLIELHDFGDLIDRETLNLESFGLNGTKLTLPGRQILYPNAQVRSDRFRLTNSVPITAIVLGIIFPCSRSSSSPQHLNALKSLSQDEAEGMMDRQAPQAQGRVKGSALDRQMRSRSSSSGSSSIPPLPIMPIQPYPACYTPAPVLLQRTAELQDEHLHGEVESPSEKIVGSSEETLSSLSQPDDVKAIIKRHFESTGKKLPPKSQPIIVRFRKIEEEPWVQDDQNRSKIVSPQLQTKKENSII